MKSPDPSDLLGEEDETAVSLARDELLDLIKTLKKKRKEIQAMKRATDITPAELKELNRLGGEYKQCIGNLFTERERVGKLGDRFGMGQYEPEIDFDEIRSQIRSQLDNLRKSKDAE